MAGGKKKAKGKGDKQRASRRARGSRKAPARRENVEGEQELDDKELDDISGGGDVARSRDPKEFDPSGWAQVNDVAEMSRPRDDRSRVRK